MKGYDVFDRDFGFLFNSYYNTVGDRVIRAHRGNLTRPSVKKIYEYRSYVDKHMKQLLIEENDEIHSLVELGLNHEQQHQELFITDLKYILGHNPLFPVYLKEYDLTNHQNSEQGFLEVDAGNYHIGFEDEGFSYDNEKACHHVYLHDFQISKSLVTNAEYLDFIEDGGYERFELWLDEGWTWIMDQKITTPKYWHQIDGQIH